jgi:VWFA-related protein
MRRTLSAAVALAWPLTCLAEAPATPPARPASPPEFGAAITLVTLPVFVVDGQGRSVAGLKREDFEITDEGRAMPLLGFQEIDVAETAEPERVRELPPAARRQFLLFFDLSFSSVNGLVRSRRAAIDFVKTMGPADLGAVATFSASKGVRLLVGFTSDRFQLQRAVETLGVMQLDARADPLGLAYDLTEVGSAFSDVVTQEANNAFAEAVRAIQIRFEQAQQAVYRQRVLALFEGLGQMATALDSVQGRKQVIFLSSGFDESSLTGQQGVQSSLDSDAVVRGRLWEVQSENRFGDSGLRHELLDNLRRFSASDAVVHTVDLSGLAARGDAAQQATEPARRSGRESLAEIASLTGGRFFKDTNDPGAALGEIADMSRHYYLLAFEPQERRGAGKFHALKVRLKNRSLRVSHRSGYFERVAYAERTPLARRFEAAEVIAKGVTGGEIPLRALAIPYQKVGEAISLPVVLEADGPALLAKAGEELGVEVYGYAVDRKGTVQDFVALASNLSLAKVGDKIRRHGLQCHATFVLAPGEYSLRFLVRESQSGRSGSYWLDVNVPRFEAGEVMLFPPLFMAEPADRLVLEATSRRAQAPASPFRVADDPFTPRARPTVTNGRKETLCLLAFDGGRHYDPGAAFEIKPALVDGSGEAVPGARFQLAKAVAGDDGFRRFVLSFVTDGVATGDYRVRVRLRDPGSGRISEAYQAVRIDR